MFSLGIMDLIASILMVALFFVLQTYVGRIVYAPLKKYGVVIGFLTGVIIVAISTSTVLLGLPENSVPERELFENYGDIFTFGLSSATFLTRLGIWLMIGSLLYFLVNHVRQSLNVVIAFIGVIVIYFISRYAIADSDMIPEVQEAIRKGKIAPMTEGDMKFVDGSVVMAYIMLALAFGAALISSIIGFVKQ